MNDVVIVSEVAVDAACHGGFLDLRGAVENVFSQGELIFQDDISGLLAQPLRKGIAAGVIGVGIGFVGGVVTADADEKLAEIRSAAYAHGGFTGFGQSRHEDRQQDADDGNNNQEFNKGKRGAKLTFGIH